MPAGMYIAKPSDLGTRLAVAVARVVAVLR